MIGWRKGHDSSSGFEKNSFKNIEMIQIFKI